MSRAFPRLCPVLFATGLVLGSMAPTSAHDVWLTISGPAARRHAIVNYGHPDDRPPALADKVVDFFAITPKGRNSLLEGLAAASDNGVQVVRSKPFDDAGHTLLAARYDNGFWVKTSDGLYRNATRRLIQDAAESIWSGKFAKAITGADAPWQQPLGHDLELVPLTDPAKAKPGETLKVKVVFRGKPLADAEVERGDGKTAVAEKDIPRFKTDADGVATIAIARRGPHLLVIDHRESPSATPDQATADLYNATLWFDVVAKP